MRRWLSLLLPAALLLSLAACGVSGEEAAPSGDPPETAVEGTGAAPSANGGHSDGGTQEGILVAYFSWADNAVLAENVDVVTSPSVVAPGNVQQLAGWVREETGGDLFPIRVTDPYPSDWDDCLARANEERGADARPDLMENVEDLDQYGTVFLGYPNWWYGVPMALLTFLEQNDLSGKDVYLFCSHGTGGLARSVELITEAAPEANISDSIFDCYEEDAASSEADIKAWVHELGFGPADNTEQAQTARQIQVQSDGGTVVFAGRATGSMWSYGNLVIVDHGNGKQTYYGHCSSVLVSAGDKVYQGQPIAKVGSTGRSTGNHCHFEVKINGTSVNPLSYLS